MEQTTRTGVLAVTVPHAGPQILAQAELLGVFTGLVVTATARSATFRTCGGEAGPCRCPRACSGICCRR